MASEYVPLNKSASILSKLNEKYDDEGVLTKDYYHGLLKDQRDNAKFVSPNHRPGQLTLDSFGKKPEPAPAVEAPATETPAVKPKVEPMDPLARLAQMRNKAPEMEAEKAPAVPAKAPAPAPVNPLTESRNKFYKLAENYPGMKDTLKWTGNALKDHWNNRVMQFYDEGAIKTPEMEQFVKGLLGEVNSVKTPEDYFNIISRTLTRTGSAARKKEEGAPQDPMAAQKHDLVRHMIMSVNAHVKIDDDTREMMKGVLMQRMQNYGFVDTAIGQKALSAVDDMPEGITFKEMGLYVGRAVLPMLGDLAEVPQGEQAAFREDAQKLNSIMFNNFGISTMLSKSNMSNRTNARKVMQALALEDQW